MFDAPLPRVEARGTRLLLDHCYALTRVEDARPPAFRRLEQEVGSDLARLLVAALRRRRARGPIELAA